MSDNDLAKRLAALPSLAGLPASEIEWLATHGGVDRREMGSLLAPKGKRIENLWILLNGYCAIYVDRGTGPRLAMEWRPGDIGGMLPYSRMKGPPGDSKIVEESEIYMLHEREFPGLINNCPVFTAMTVHIMIDRARSFNASELQDEKMISLGKLAAGMAHELNNPASATVRSAKLLLDGLKEADQAARALGATGLTPAQIEAIEKTRTVCVSRRSSGVLSALDLADREDAISEWLDRHGADGKNAAQLAETDVSIESLDKLAGMLPSQTLGTALRWIASGCSIHALANDIERAAGRIYDLVASVKKFTYMDTLASREAVDVGGGLQDTIRIAAAKARGKSASVTLDLEPGLPKVQANGGELNQVWMNLIDNALDAIGEGGTVAVSARRELDRVVVRILDNGPGIPPEILPKIFDPFFTTKPPGQGTGLGLDITRRLLRHFYGDIDIVSKPGQTECRVRLLVEKPSSSELGSVRG